MKRILAVCLVVVGLFVICVCGPAQADLRDGQVTYYPFNGNANDESGNGNDGTANGITLTTDRFGNPDSAYSFDGSAGYIDLGDDTFDIGDQFSLVFWYKSTQGTFGRFLDKDTDAGYGVLFSDTDTLLFRVDDGTNYADAEYTNADLKNGEWRFVVCTWDGSETKLYVDADLKSSGSNSSVGSLVLI